MDVKNVRIKKLTLIERAFSMDCHALAFTFHAHKSALRAVYLKGSNMFLKCREERDFAREWR